NIDYNADADKLDNILRVYEPPSTTELTGTNQPADAQPVIGNRSVAISGTRVFYRVPEADRKTVRVSVAFDGSEDAGGVEYDQIGLSASGRFVAFTSSDELVAADANGA